MEALLARYAPDAVVVEDVGARRSRRCQRVRAFVREISGIAEGRGAAVRSVSTDAVRRMFSSAEARNKEQIADAITGHFPELAPWRPPFRKPWMSEDARMAIFDAVAFALAYFFFEEDESPIKAA